MIQCGDLSWVFLRVTTEVIKTFHSFPLIDTSNYQSSSFIFLKFFNLEILFVIFQNFGKQISAISFSQFSMCVLVVLV